MGPLATKGNVSAAILGAEKALIDAVCKMYPALRLEGEKSGRGLEYGYRLRDAPQMSEVEIRAGGNPFANVIPVDRSAAAPPPAESGLNPVLRAMAAFENLFRPPQ